MKKSLGESTEENKKKVKRGYSLWVEESEWFTAKKVSSRKFGPHRYFGILGRGPNLGDCVCGCHMGGYSSSGDVDPFGPCPKNPK